MGLFLACCAGAALGQPAAPVEFEGFSIKLSAPVDQPKPADRFFGCRGGPGSSAPGQITCSHEVIRERCKLAVHRETREMPVYELVVAKGGVKAKKWVELAPGDTPEPWEPGTMPKRDEQGFPLVAPGQTSTVHTQGKAWYIAPAGTMQDLARMLEWRLSLNPGDPRPVIDATGLTGKYDLKLSWSPLADNNDSAEGPSMLSRLKPPTEN